MSNTILSVQNKANSILLLVAATCGAAWTVFVQNDPFFWDTVQLASKHAHFFYENGLKWQLLPQNIDSGHPPLLGYYLAVCWTFLGKTLAVSHWAIWPFLTLLLFTAVKIGTLQEPSRHLGWLFPILLFSDPVLLGQSALVSPDILVVLGLAGTVYGHISGKRNWIFFSVLLLCTSSMRGMMTAAAIFGWVVFAAQSFTFRHLLKAALPFLPGAIAGMSFLIWHYYAAGWVGHFEGSDWAGAFERVNLKGAIRNAAIIAWRFLDFNRFLVFFFLLFALYRTGLKQFWQLHQPEIKLLLWLSIFLLPSAVLYQNLSAHRYFLPLFFNVQWLVFSVISKQSHLLKFTPRTIILSLSVLLFAGNAWIYPRGVSMDWDSSLAHWPYHHLRASALQYLDENKIDFETVGSAFPNLNTGENLLLNGDTRQFAPLDLEQNKWIFASNIFNDIDTPEYERLEKEWESVQRWESRGVWIVLYRKMR